MKATYRSSSFVYAAALVFTWPALTWGQGDQQRPAATDSNRIAQPPEPSPIPASPRPSELLPPAPVALDAPEPQVKTEPPLTFQTPGTFSAGPVLALFGKELGHMPVIATYKAAWFPDEEVRGQNTNLGYQQHDLSLAFPLYQDTCNEWSANAKVRSEFFHTGAVLPDSGQPFPNELWNIHFGTTYRHRFENDWIAGIGAFIGSASDKPFHSIDEMTLGFNGFVRIPSGERNAWLLSLNYSPTNELSFPIPGVAYVWNPSDQFMAHIGLPFMVVWRPTDDWTLNFSYMLIRTVHARATYRLASELRAHVSFDWANETYFLADRVNVNDRFFYYDKRLTTGLQYIVSKHALVDLSGGYVFDRFYFEGAQFSGDSHRDRVDIGNGAFASLQFQVRW
jgi:hypothetical protein